MAFFTTRAEPLRPNGKKVYEGPLVLTSTDHPLHFPQGAPRDLGPDNVGRLQAAPKLSQPNGFAGNASGKSTSVRTVLTGVEDGFEDRPRQRAPPRGERYQYEHPTYEISRSSYGEAAKEALYGGDPAPSQSSSSATQQQQQQLPPGAEDHPALPLYNFLAEQVPRLPRDPEGNADENSVRAALQAVGVEMSIDGFAELLARCDVSATGFPPFSDFLLCLSRPARPPPSNPTSMGGAQAMPPHMQEQERAAAAMPPPPSQGEGATVAAPAHEPGKQNSVGWADDAVARPKGSAPAKPQYRSHVEVAEAAKAMQDAKNAMVMPAPRQPMQQMPPPNQERTWGQMQLEEKVKQQTRFNMPNTPLESAMNSTARLGVPLPRPTGSFPLGIKSDVPTLGTNVAQIYGKSRHASSQKFTNGFNPDHFLF